MNTRTISVLVCAVLMAACTTVQGTKEQDLVTAKETTIQSVATQSELNDLVVSVDQVVMTETFLAGKTGITGAMLYGAFDNHVLILRDETMSLSYAELVLSSKLFTGFLGLGIKVGEPFKVENVTVKELISGEKMLVPAKRFRISYKGQTLTQE